MNQKPDYKIQDEGSKELCKILDLDPALVKNIGINFPIGQVYTATVELYLTESQYRRIFRV